MKQVISRFQIEKMLSFNKSEEECSICYTGLNLDNIVETQCNHIYCVNCFIQYIQSKPLTEINIKCPFCRQIIQKVMVDDVENGFCHFHSTVIKPRRIPSEFMEPNPTANHQPIEIYDNSPFSDIVIHDNGYHIHNIILTVFLASLTNIILVAWTIIIIILYVFTLVLLLKTSIHLFRPSAVIQ
jgi:hypothetical protein